MAYRTLQEAGPTTVARVWEEGIVYFIPAVLHIQGGYSEEFLNFQRPSPSSCQLAGFMLSSYQSKSWRDANLPELQS